MQKKRPSAYIIESSEQAHAPLSPLTSDPGQNQNDAIDYDSQTDPPSRHWAHGPGVPG